MMTTRWRMAIGTALLAVGLIGASLWVSEPTRARAADGSSVGLEVVYLPAGAVVELTAPDGWRFLDGGKTGRWTARQGTAIQQGWVSTTITRDPAAAHPASNAGSLRIVSVPAGEPWPTHAKAAFLSSLDRDGLVHEGWQWTVDETSTRPASHATVRVADLSKRRVQVRVTTDKAALDTSTYVTLKRWPGSKKHCGRITDEQWRSSKPVVVAERDLPMIPGAEVRWTVKSRSTGCMAAVVDGHEAPGTNRVSFWVSTSDGVRVR